MLAALIEAKKKDPDLTAHPCISQPFFVASSLDTHPLWIGTFGRENHKNRMTPEVGNPGRARSCVSALTAKTLSGVLPRDSLPHLES
jgi:hypothetical protein